MTVVSKRHDENIQYQQKSVRKYRKRNQFIKLYYKNFMIKLHPENCFVSHGYKPQKGAKFQ